MKIMISDEQIQEAIGQKESRAAIIAAMTPEEHFRLKFSNLLLLALCQKTPPARPSES